MLWEVALWVIPIASGATTRGDQLGSTSPLTGVSGEIDGAHPVRFVGRYSSLGTFANVTQ